MTKSQNKTINKMIKYRFQKHEMLNLLRNNKSLIEK